MRKLRLFTAAFVLCALPSAAASAGEAATEGLTVAPSPVEAGATFQVSLTNWTCADIQLTIQPQQGGDPTLLAEFEFTEFEGGPVVEEFIAPETPGTYVVDARYVEECELSREQILEVIAAPTTTTTTTEAPAATTTTEAPATTTTTEAPATTTTTEAPAAPTTVDPGAGAPVATLPATGAGDSSTALVALAAFAALLLGGGLTMTVRRR